MNAVEQSLVETIDAMSKSFCNYQERQLLKTSDVRQRMSLVLSKFRRREKRIRWGFVVFCLISCLIMLIVLFGDVYKQQWPWLICQIVIYSSSFFTSAMRVRDASMSLAKLETLSDLWLRQNQSSLAEFDASKAIAETSVRIVQAN